MRVRGQIPGLAKPYVPRFEGGEVEAEHDYEAGTIMFSGPNTFQLYPGEKANLDVTYDVDADMFRYTIYIQPAPGFFPFLSRLRYLIFGAPGVTGPHEDHPVTLHVDGGEIEDA